MQRPEVGVRHWTQPAVNISGSTVVRHLAMLPDSRTDPSRVSSLSPLAAVGTGTRSQSPARTAVPKRLFKRQAVSTLSPAHTPVANEPSSNRCRSSPKWTHSACTDPFLSLVRAASASLCLPLSVKTGCTVTAAG